MRNLILRTVNIWEGLNGSMLAIAINCHSRLLDNMIIHDCLGRRSRAWLMTPKQPYQFNISLECMRNAQLIPQYTSN